MIGSGESASCDSLFTGMLLSNLRRNAVLHLNRADLSCLLRVSKESTYIICLALYPWLVRGYDPSSPEDRGTISYLSW